MDFERRLRERRVLSEPGDPASQEAMFVGLVRSGLISDAAEQEHLFAILNNSGSPESAVQRMNEFFDKYKTGLRGAYVPVETSPEAQAAATEAGAGVGATIAPPTAPEQRFVSWKRVYRPQTEAEKQALRTANEDENRLVEIPGSIEKILRVKLRNASLEALIEDGHYDYVNHRIATEPVPVDETQEDRELLLPKFDRVVTLDEIDKWLADNDLLSATLKELLAIGAQFPEEHRRVYMWALDKSEQAWRSRGRVPVLHRRAHVRDLHLSVLDRRWSLRDRFPASRKKKLPLDT